VRIFIFLFFSLQFKKIKSKKHKKNRENHILLSTFKKRPSQEKLFNKKKNSKPKINKNSKEKFKKIKDKVKHKKKTTIFTS